MLDLSFCSSHEKVGGAVVEEEFGGGVGWFFARS